MKLLTVFMFAIICGQSMADMTMMQLCSMRQKQHEQHETSVVNQYTMNLKLDNQSSLIKGLLNQMTGLMNNMTTIRHDNKELKNQMNTIIQDNEKLRNESINNMMGGLKVDLVKEIKSLRTENENLTRKLNVSEESMEDVIKINVHMESKNQKLTGHITKLNESIQNMTVLHADLEKDIKNLGSDNKNLTRKLSVCEESNGDMKGLKADLEKEIEGLRTQKQNLARKINEFEESVEDSEKKIQRLTLKVQKLKEDNSELKETVQGGNINCIIKYGPFGGTGGNPFTDETMVASGRISALHFRTNTDLVSIAVTYGSTKTLYRGLKSGSGHTASLALDEYITGMKGRHGKYFAGHNVITQLTFITNKRTIGPYGSAKGTTFSVNLKDKRLAYISGKKGGRLDSINLHFYC